MYTYMYYILSKDLSIKAYFLWGACPALKLSLAHLGIGKH